MRTFKFFALVLLVFSVVSCRDYTLSGDWAKAPSIAGVLRTAAVSFVIDDIAYVGLGLGDKSAEFQSFYKYDATTGNWTSIANFPGKGRHGAVAFVVNGKGYVGTGYISAATYPTDRKKEWLKDFWCYDPVSDSWTQIDDFPGEARKDGIAFAMGDYGYVGTGEGVDAVLFKDIYSYNAVTGKWSQSDIGFIGDARKGATAFVVGGHAYVCLGKASSSLYLPDNSRFTPDGQGGGSWVSMQALTNKPQNKQDLNYGKIPRSYAVSFVTDKGNNGLPYAYIALGDQNGSTVWRYDHNRDQWFQREDVPFQYQVIQAVSFTINGYGYFTTGAGAHESTSGKTETWKFFPDIREDRTNDYSGVY